MLSKNLSLSDRSNLGNTKTGQVSISHAEKLNKKLGWKTTLFFKIQSSRKNNHPYQIPQKFTMAFMFNNTRNVGNVKPVLSWSHQEMWKTSMRTQQIPSYEAIEPASVCTLVYQYPNYFFNHWIV